MSARRILLTLVALLSLLLLLAGLAQAQGFGFDQEEAPQSPTGIEVFVDPAAVPDPAPATSAAPVEMPAEEPAGPDLPQEPLGGVGAAASMSDVIPFQGRLTSAAGSPLNGSYSVTLALYDVAVGGTAVCTDTDTVTVTNGLFVFNMNSCSASDTDGRQLYLGIKVGADPEMTPRQPVYPAPYARSLRPGAIVNQTITNQRGLIVQSAGPGAAGTALWAQNSNATGGIGLWSTVAGGDSSIVASNNGGGPLFKGFGSDGGEDEIRINNNGSIETKADSYVFVPGAALVKNLSADTTRWDIQTNGAARIWRGANAGGKTVYYPVALPTRLYGRSVEVESVTVYYVVSNGSQAYIGQTFVNKQLDADSPVQLIANDTHRTSTTATGYVLSPTANSVLNTNEGLAVWLNLYFANDTDWVQIGGIRIQLGHHSLY